MATSTIPGNRRAKGALSPESVLLLGPALEVRRLEVAPLPPPLPPALTLPLPLLPDLDGVVGPTLLERWLEVAPLLL